MKMLLPVIAALFIVCPILLMKKGINRDNAKRRVLCQIAMFAGVFAMTLVVGGVSVFAEETTATATAFDGSIAQGLGFLSAAVATGCSSLGAGIAVGSAAPAAIGAISENSDNFGKAMIFVALGEGVAIYGLLISILIINQL